MLKREDSYIEKLYREFVILLDDFVDSDIIERSNRASILNELKSLIDTKIRRIQNEDYLM